MIPVKDIHSLEDLHRKYPYFSAVRVALGGGVDSVMSYFRGTSSLLLKRVDSDALEETSDNEIVSRFLRQDNLRIVVDNEKEEEDIITEAQIDEDDDLVSEELAEVYLQQGLKEEAKAIFSKLSLLNPEKSIYFVERIKRIDNN